MRISWGAAILAIGVAACAHKTASTAPAPAPAPAPRAATAPAPAPTPAGAARAGAPAAAPAARPAAAQAAAAPTAALTQDQFPMVMKTVASTAGSARTKIMMSQLPDAAKDLQTLATTFGNVEKFFASKNKSDAVMFAQTARMAATAAAGAATAGDAMKASTELGNMQATCKQCHAAYREPGPAPNTFQFKAGAI